MSSPTVTGAEPRAREGKGRNSSDLRRRIVRHFLPLTVVSVAVLALFVNVSFFDANRYPPPGDIFTEGLSGALPSGTYPQGGAAMGGMPDMGASGGSPSMQHGPGQTGMPPGMQHGPGQTGMPPGMQHGPGQGMPGAASGSGEDTATRHAGDMDTVLRMRLLSTGSGYVALGLLGLTLLIGPANLVLGRRNPVSSYLRRDVGIFAAIGCVVHMVLGFLVKHNDGQILGYFLESGNRSRILTNSFGLANWAGLLAVVIAATLAVISSDAALRKLRAKRWKRIQRLNYALFALVIVHSVLYGALWRRTSPYTVLLGLSVVAVATGQAIGVRLWRKKAREPVTATA